MNSTVQDSIPTRASLLDRLKDWEDQESWRDFRNTYWRLIFRSAKKAGLNEEEAKDVAQETLKKVAEKIRAFFYDPSKGSFKGWLYCVTRASIISHYRKRLPRIGAVLGPQAEEHLLNNTVDQASLDLPLETWEEEWKQNLFQAAMSRLKNRVPPRQLQIFDLYESQNWPVGRVAETMGVSRTRVYVTKHRIKSLLKREIARLQEELI